MESELPRRFGPYVLLRRLGQGGMGDAHLARGAQAAMPELVVVKRLHRDLGRVEGFTRRFRHEAEFASLIDSPYVARVYDSGSIEGVLYFAMEYIPGLPAGRIFGDLKRAERSLTVEQAIDLIEGGLRGLHAIHTARHPDTGDHLGAVHRDVSPRNLLVPEDGMARVIDLGIGKSRLKDWKTRTGDILGSPGYLSPEQVRGGEADPRSDTYSMGVVLFEALTLTPYIPRGPVASMLQSCARPELRPPSSLRSDLPRGLDDVLRTALAVSPGERFHSAREFLDSLRAVVPEGGSDTTVITAHGDLLGRLMAERQTIISELRGAGPATASLSTAAEVETPTAPGTQDPTASGAQDRTDPGTQDRTDPGTQDRTAPLSQTPIAAPTASPVAGRGWRALAIVLAMFAMIAVGVMLDRVWLRPNQAPARFEPASAGSDGSDDREVVARPAPRIQETQAFAKEAPREPPAPPETPEKTPARPVGRPNPTAPAPDGSDAITPLPEASSASEVAERDLAALGARMRALQGRFGESSPEGRALARLQLELLLARRSEGPAALARTVARVRAELDGLERGNAQ